MYAPLALLLCCVAGSALGYYAQRDAPYNLGPNDPYSVAVNPNFIPEPSQRLFWGNGQGSNQVGGTGLWAMFTNKFPFLGSMFGRMELPNQYGPPQFNSNQYGPPQFNSNQYDYYNQGYQSQPQYNQVPPQFYQGQQFYQRQSPRSFAPAGRDVAITDDAVIVTPPQVPIGPAPAPAPVPEPAPGGYQYNKPQYRLELPHK